VGRSFLKPEARSPKPEARAPYLIVACDRLPVHAGDCVDRG
jgi:hypothetical protein